MSQVSTRSRLELIASLPANERAELLRGLSDADAHAALYDWRGMLARPNQIQPAGNWVHWLVLAGRGWGKTKTGGETVREWAREKLPGPIHLVAPTNADIRKVMVEGPSGLLSCYPSGEQPTYQPSLGHMITWPNGNIAYCFSAEEPERLRGPQCCRYYADELCAWSRAEETWDMLMFGFRIGDDLRGVITTTPKPTTLLKDIIANPATVTTRGSTYDNRANLAPAFFEEIIRKYEGTRIGRQELNAEILEDFPGALWTRAMIDSARIRPEEVQWDMIVRVVVAIDPAVTAGEKSDETGIVAAALTRSGHILVLDDESCRESPLGWARVAVGLYKRRRADRIVAEVNNGGDLVAANLQAVDASIPYRAVHASRGKAVRAEPIAALYEQGRVHHVGMFALMEDQLCIAGGSLVETKRGHIPIERVHAGDWALTRIGWCRVKWAGQTGTAAVKEVRAGGSTLRCTGSHPIWSNGKFTPCFEVQKGCTILTCHTRSNVSSSNSRERNTFSTVMDTSRRADLAGSYCSIDQSGKRLTVQSRKGGTFTTSILTEETILSPTSGHFPSLTMSKHTVAREGHGKQPLKSAQLEARHSGSSVNDGKLTAQNVERNAGCDPLAARVFVETTVESVTACEYPEPVYNLSVEDQPEFFANGILVHNCSFVPGITDKSPDRMDALVWACTELVIDPEEQEMSVIRERDWYQISAI